MPDGDLEQQTGSFIAENDGVLFHYHCTSYGVACNHSDGDEDKFSIRMKGGLHLRGLTEGEAIAALWTPPSPEDEPDVV